MSFLGYGFGSVMSFLGYGFGSVMSFLGYGLELTKIQIFQKRWV